MPSDDYAENRLRELLRDPAWSLPPWPDPEPRVRRAARRQRLRSSAAAAGVSAVAAALVLSPLARPGAHRAVAINAATTDVLACRDSAGQQGRGKHPARLVGGVDGFIGDANAFDVLPVQRLDGHRYLALESDLAVASSAGSYRTVSVVSPASARLGYGSGSLAPSRRVRMPACGPRYTLYLGSIFVRQPACVILAVSGPAAQPVTVAVPVRRSCRVRP